MKFGHKFEGQVSGVWYQVQGKRLPQIWQLNCASSNKGCLTVLHPTRAAVPANFQPGRRSTIRKCCAKSNANKSRRNFRSITLKMVIGCSLSYRHRKGNKFGTASLNNNLLNKAAAAHTNAPNSALHTKSGAPTVLVGACVHAKSTYLHLRQP